MRNRRGMIVLLLWLSVWFITLNRFSYYGPTHKKHLVEDPANACVIIDFRAPFPSDVFHVVGRWNCLWTRRYKEMVYPQRSGWCDPKPRSSTESVNLENLIVHVFTYWMSFPDGYEIEHDGLCTTVCPRTFSLHRNARLTRCCPLGVFGSQLCWPVRQQRRLCECAASSSLDSDLLNHFLQDSHRLSW